MPYLLYWIHRNGKYCTGHINASNPGTFEQRERGTDLEKNNKVYLV